VCGFISHTARGVNPPGDIGCLLTGWSFLIFRLWRGNPVARRWRAVADRGVGGFAEFPRRRADGDTSPEDGVWQSGLGGYRQGGAGRNVGNRADGDAMRLRGVLASGVGTRAADPVARLPRRVWQKAPRLPVRGSPSTLAQLVKIGGIPPGPMPISVAGKWYQNLQYTGSGPK
jgi:hypothetical protein